jgi:protease IV
MKKRGIITLIVIFGGLFLGLLVFIGVLVAAFSPDGFGGPDDRIGVVEVDGAIMESKAIIENLRRFENDDTVRGVVVRVDSPGGAVAPSQEIYYAIRRLKERKPVVISMGTVAASGGYYVACGADVIFANPGTITGSIGVITQFFNVERLVERFDLEVNTITSGQYKDAGSPFKPFAPEDEAYFAGMVGDIHRQFVEDVADCREMGLDEASELADGRIFTGRQARDLNLVDYLGSLQDAVDYIAVQVELEDPPIVYPPEDRLGLFGELFKVAVQSASAEVQDQTSPRVLYQYTGPR